MCYIQINHPEKYDDLTTAWEEFYPGCRSHNPAEDTYKNEVQQGYVPPSLEITGIRGYTPLSLQDGTLCDYCDFLLTFAVDIQESDLYKSQEDVKHYVVQAVSKN